MIYAMTGGMGSGKTTFALRLAKEKGALFLSLDKTIKDFNQPIHSLEDYESYMKRALEKMSAKALRALQADQSVIFDFGGGMPHRAWLLQMARAAGAQIEIYHLEVPREERKRRVQQRNLEKVEGVFHFHMSDEEFERQNKQEPSPPPVEEGVQVIRVPYGQS